MRWTRLLWILLTLTSTVALGQSTQTLETKLASIEGKLDKIQAQNRWNSPALLLPAVAALVGAAGGWLAGYLTKRLELQQTQRAQVSNEVVESLKWFEGGSQGRSIGIAYVETRISDDRYKLFSTVWGSVLANQVIYLLTGSEQRGSFHEQDNLERLLNLLNMLPVVSGYGSVRRAYEWKTANPDGKGVSLTPRIRELVQQLPAI